LLTHVHGPTQVQNLDHECHDIEESLLDAQSTLQAVHQAKYWTKVQKQEEKAKAKEEVIQRGRKFSARTQMMQDLLMDAK
jgi:hypothetical protein